MMTWTNILKKACNFCLVGATVSLLLISITNANAACKNGVIFVGDSRTVGMSGLGGNEVNKKDSEGNYWIAKVGAGLSWFTSTAVGQVNAVVKDYGTVVISLGVNDINNSSKYISTIKTEGKKWIAQGKKVKFTAALPVGSKYTTVANMNDLIKNFNTALKNGLSGSGISFITFATPQESDFVSDGLHFNAAASKKFKASLISSVCSDRSSHDEALSGNDCVLNTSSSVVRDNKGNPITCSTVAQMLANGSNSALASYGSECSTKASSCNSAAVKSVSQYRDAGNKSCFQGMPVAVGSISSVVGMRPVGIGVTTSKCVRDPDTGVKMREHQGMDVGGNNLAPIEAPADGLVVFAEGPKKDNSSRGTVIIQHNLNPNDPSYSPHCSYYYTIFYHMSMVLVKTNSKVTKQTTFIGNVGDGSGYFAPHMHMEVRKCSQDGEVLNPLCPNNDYLCNNRSDGVAQPINPAGAIGSNNGAPVNPYLNQKENCDLFDDADCQKEPKAAKCPTKTKTKEQCEERNKAIEIGGTYCPPSDDKNGGAKANQADSCLISVADTKSACSNGTKQPQQSISKDITNAINECSKKYGFSPVFLAGFINLESAFNPQAKNKNTTASGLGQILKDTWNSSCTEYGSFESARFDIRSNVMCMGAVLTANKKIIQSRANWTSYQGINLEDTDLLVYSYFQGNGGLDNAVKAGGVNWKNATAPATSINASGLAYINTVNCHMKNIASYNNCAFSGGQICEYFNYTNSYGGGSGSLYDYANGRNMADNEVTYKCTISAASNDISGCLFCDMFKTIFNASSAVAKKCHKTFAESLVSLVAIGLAISLAHMIMPYMVNMTVQDPHRLMNDILHRIFTVLVVILLLKMDVSEFFEMFISPIFNTGMRLAELAISTNVGNDIVSLYTFDGIDGSGLPADMATSMLSAIYAIQVRLEQLWSLGANTVCIAFYVESFHHYPIFPHFGYLITGLLMLLTSVVFMLIYPFLLIDAVLQFGIASSLLPLAIAATAFKPTRQYLNLMKILSIFMNAMFIFIFLTIVMFILLAGIEEAIFPHIKRAYEDADAGHFNIQEFGWFTQTFIKIIFFVFLGKAVLEDIPSFAEQFGEAFSYGQSFGKPDMGIGRKIGGTAVGAATNVATTVGGKAWSATKAAGRGAKSFIGAAAKEGRRTYLINKTRRKASALAATAAAGTATAAGAAWVSGRTWYGRKVQRRVTTDQHGNTVLETRKRSLFRNRRIVNQDDGNMAVTKKIKKDGSISESYKIKTPYGKNLLNADGTKNKDAIDYLMQNSGLAKDTINKIMLNQLMKERLPGVKRGLGKEFLKDNSFLSEQVISSVDDKGREVFEVRRVGKDGYVNVFRMTKGENRDLIEYERIDKKGNAKKWASDGVIQMKMGYKYELDGQGNVVLNDDGSFKRKDGPNTFCEFSNAKAYKGVKIFDSNGKRTYGMENEELMFSDVDLQSYQYQMKRYGDVLRHSAFGK